MMDRPRLNGDGGNDFGIDDTDQPLDPGSNLPCRTS